MSELIRVENLSMSYESRQVLSDVSFTLGRGDCLYVLGENGTGKSTLIKGLLGLKSKDSGSVTYLGGLSQKDVGYLPQSTAAQKNFPATVREIVMSGRLNRKSRFGIYKKSDKQEVAEIMQRMGISELADQSFGSLSGGQQQRVLLCRALAAATKILVLDEPTAFLDQNAAEDMYNSLLELKEKGLTIVMVSHDISAAAKYASHVLYLKHKPLFFGTKRDFFASGIAAFPGGDEV